MGPADAMIPLAAAVLQAGTTEPERVLAIECGDGEGALFLAREFPRARVRGVDSDEAQVAQAKARVGLDPEGRIAFKLGSTRRLPFPDDHFDLVVQEAGSPAVEEAARVLRFGGRFLIVHQQRPRGDRLGLRRRWADRRLARSGFELIQEGGAGGGSFFVNELRKRVPGQPSD